MADSQPHSARCGLWAWGNRHQNAGKLVSLPGQLIVLGRFAKGAYRRDGIQTIERRE
jgi:hypothetical protein